MSTPSTTIGVCKGVPLNNKYDHTFYFADQAEQMQYFVSKTDKTFSAYTTPRKSWSLKVESTFEEAAKWSYLFFQRGTGKKMYYYFITNVEYINDATVELSLEMDVIQTYMFDWKLYPSFIERNHTPLDVPSENTVDEGLEIGDLVTMREWHYPLNNCAIMVLSSIQINTTTEGNRVNSVCNFSNGIFSGLSLWAVHPANWQYFGIQLDNINKWGFSDGIIAMWMYPMELINLTLKNPDGSNHWYIDGDAFANSVDDFKMVTFNNPEYEDSITLDGYTPKNSKSYQYPYRMLYCSNNMGGSATYKFEHFAVEGEQYFKVVPSSAPEGIVKIFPLNYKGIANNYEEGLTLTGFPSCAWSSDTYKLWLAQTQNTRNHDMTSSIIKGGIGLLTTIGGIAGAIATGGAGAAVGGGAAASGVSMMISSATDIQGQLAQKKDAEVQPPQSKGNHSGSANMVSGYQGFSFYEKTVDFQHAKAIDNFFTMFGYRINAVQTPSINNRPYYTYIKTRGLNLDGDFCQSDKQAICNIFDKGLTFWKRPNLYGNYDVNNSPT